LIAQGRGQGGSKINSLMFLLEGNTIKANISMLCGNFSGRLVGYLSEWIGGGRKIDNSIHLDFQCCLEEYKPDT